MPSLQLGLDLLTKSQVRDRISLPIGFFVFRELIVSTLPPLLTSSSLAIVPAIHVRPQGSDLGARLRAEGLVPFEFRLIQHL